MQVKDGHLVLTPKEQSFFTNYFAGLNQSQAALAAGYTQSSHREMGRRLVRKLHSFPAELWKECMGEAGITLPYMAARLKQAMAGQNDKVALNSIRMGLAAYGIGTTAETANGNATFNIQGPTMVFVGEEEMRKKLREGTKQIAEPAPTG